MRAWVGAAALALLSGCDSGEPEPVHSIQVPDGGARARIEALSDVQRDAVLLRAVRDAGHDCQQVIGSAYNGEHFEMPSWAARCADGRDWLIMLGKDGRALVARREEAAR